MNTKNATFWILTLTLLSGGCSALKKVDQMKKTTEEMNESTKQMKQDMSVMKQQTGDMLEYTTSLYAVAVQGGAEAARRENLKSMDDAPTLNEKNVYAGHYYGAVELQFWKLVAKHGDQNELDAHIETVVQDFVGKMGGYFDQLKLRDANEVELKPMMEEIFAAVADPALDGAMKLNYWQNVRQSMFAMILALHKTNPLHKRIQAKYPDFKPFSMKGLLEEGLETAVAVRNGKINSADLPEWKRILVREEALITYIFQLRHNLLPGVALTRLAGYRQMSMLGSETLGRWWNTQGICQDKDCWDPKLETIKNEVDLEYLAVLMEQATKQREYLENLNIEPLRDPKCIALLQNMANPLTNQSRPSLTASPHLSSALKYRFYQGTRAVIGAPKQPTEAAY